MSFNTHSNLLNCGCYRLVLLSKLTFYWHTHLIFTKAISAHGNLKCIILFASHPYNALKNIEFEVIKTKLIYNGQYNPMYTCWCPTDTLCATWIDIDYIIINKKTKKQVQYQNPCALTAPLRTSVCFSGTFHSYSIMAVCFREGMQWLLASAES